MTLKKEIDRIKKELVDLSFRITLGKTLNELIPGEEMKIVKVDLTKEPLDEENFGYALCKCTRTAEAIRVPRPDHTEFISFKCPNCGEPLGITLKGRFDSEPLDISKFEF